MPRLHEPGGRPERRARPHEPPRRDADLLLARADRAPHRLQAADGLGVSLRLDLQHGLRVRLRARADPGAGAGDSRGEADAREPARVARGLGRPGRREARGRDAREPELDRVRPRQRHRLPHVHGVRARPVRLAVLLVAARPDAEGAAGGTAGLAEGRVPGLRVATAVVLRDDAVVDEPLAEVLAFIEAYGAPGDASEPDVFGERDLRSANRGGARISAAQIAAILERRVEIELALREIPPEASLAGRAVPWAALTRLFAGFAGVKGVGYSKMTKTLHPKRPALIPMLDSVVQRYLGPHDSADLAFDERATELVRAYKRDLDRNRAALRALERELASRGYRVTAGRILDVLIWSAFALAP